VTDPARPSIEDLLREADRTQAELLLAEPGRPKEAALDAATDAFYAYRQALEAEAEEPEL